MPATTTAPAASGCTATYQSTSRSALAATIKVTNNGPAISVGWTVTWTWDTGNPKITGAVNASVSQSGKAVSANSGLLSSLLLPKASTTFTISGQGHPVSPVPTLTCTLH